MSRWPIALSLLFAFTAAPSFAQETLRMQSVTIEDEEGNHRSILGSESIEDRQAQDLEDTFRNTPEVAVGGSSRVAQKIYVRGLEDTNLNVTVDGARQSGYLFHHQGRLNIDPEILKQVEVESGTGDALSGPGSLGGSIRFVTKDPEDLLMPGQISGAFIKSKYSSNNDEKGGALALFTKPNEKWSGLLYGHISESEDSRTGQGGQAIPYTASRPRAWLGKIVARPSLSQKLTVGHNFTSDNATRLVRSNIGFSGTQPITDKIFETRNTTLNYRYFPNSRFVNIEAEVYRANNKLEHSNGSSMTLALFESWGSSMKNTFHFSSFRIVAGFDWNQDIAKAQNFSRAAHETGRIYGIFFQSTFELTEKWRLGSGLRFDDYELINVDDTELSDTHFSPNANVRYKWNKNVSTTLRWSQAFRGPTPAEAFLLANASSVAPARDLKGTVAETVELSTTVTGSNTTLQLTGFQTKLIDPLESSISSGVVTRANAKDSVSIEGYQAQYKRVIDDWAGTLFYIHTKTKMGQAPMGYTGNSTRGVSLGDRAGLIVDRKIPKQGMVVSWSSVLVAKLTDVPAGQKAQDGYDIHDISWSWLASERVKTGLSIHNILDRKYIAQGSVYANSAGNENFLYEPGRDFRINFSYIF